MNTGDEGSMMLNNTTWYQR